MCLTKNKQGLNPVSRNYIGPLMKVERAKGNWKVLEGDFQASVYTVGRSHEAAVLRAWENPPEDTGRIAREREGFA